MAPGDRDLRRWVGGVKFARVLVHSLGRACHAAGVELVVLCDSEHLTAQLPAGVSVVLLPPQRHSRIESRLRSLIALPPRSSAVIEARKRRLATVLTLNGESLRGGGIHSVAWIPDFQHLHLPDYFSAAHREFRDYSYRLIAETSRFVLLSSEATRADFARFSPAHAHKARVIPFCSLIAFEAPAGDPAATRRRFHVPEKYAMVANQFWHHKNHRLVVEALEQLQRRNIRIHVVMAGLPADNRDPTNEAFSQLLQYIAQADLASSVTVLGGVSDDDMINLMRAATVVIQPSRFEGWSTVVQDAKALGRPLMCSDIPVLREQAPQALGFFPCDRADRLADLLAECWPSLPPGPDIPEEEQALAREREFARRHGEALLRMCRSASGPGRSHSAPSAIAIEET